MTEPADAEPAVSERFGALLAPIPMRTAGERIADVLSRVTFRIDKRITY